MIIIIVKVFSVNPTDSLLWSFDVDRLCRRRGLDHPHLCSHLSQTVRNSEPLLEFALQGGGGGAHGFCPNTLHGLGFTQFHGFFLKF